MPSSLLTSSLNTLGRKVVLAFLAAAFLGGLVFLTYGQRDQAVFVLDDQIFILENPSIRSAELSLPAMGNVIAGAANRPLPFISFFVDWYRSGGNPEVFYRTNVVIHLVNALLVFFLASQFFLISGHQASVGASTLGLVAAGLWTVHPIHMNAVAYICQRMTEMAALFVFASLYCYLRARTDSSMGRKLVYFGCAALLWLVACVCKENAWIAPAFAVLLEFGVVRNQSPQLFRNAAERWICWLVLGTAVATVLSLAANMGPLSAYLERSYRGWDFTMEQRLLTQPRVLLFHVSQLLWPAPSRFAIEHDIIMSTDWHTPASTLPALVLLALWAAVGVALLLCQGRRFLGALVLFPLLALTVESSIIPLDMVFEHRMYLPSFTLFLLASIGIFLLPTRFAMATAGILLISSAACQVAYLNHWNSRLTIYERAASQAPTSIRVQYNYANALVASGRHLEAVDHYRLALSAPSPSVNRFDSINASSIHFNLGLAQFNLNRLHDARQSLEAAVQSNPDHIKAHAFLVDVSRAQGDVAGVRRHLEHILRLDPANTRVRGMLLRLSQ